MYAVEVDNLYFRSVAEIGWIHFTAIFHKVNTIFFSVRNQDRFYVKWSNFKT